MIEITAEQLVNDLGIGEYVPITNEYIYNLPTPKTIHDKLYGSFNEITVKMPGTFVLRIPDAIVAGEIGVAIYKDYLITDTAIKKEYLSKPTEIIPVDVACTSISHIWSNNNYFHWILSSLSRLYLLKESAFFNKDDIFFANSVNNKYEIDSLLMSGVTLVQPNNNKWWKCKELTIPSPMTHDAVTSPEGCKYLRRNYTTKKNSNIEKIAIARRGSRKIVNSDQIYGYLESIGYKTIFCEDYTFEEQIALFSGTKYIVAPHGAGLANMVFCKEGTKALEILSPDYLNICFRKVAAYSGLDYNFLLGEGEISLEEHPKSDILVDINKLKKALELMSES